MKERGHVRTQYLFEGSELCFPESDYTYLMLLAEYLFWSKIDVRSWLSQRVSQLRVDQNLLLVSVYYYLLCNDYTTHTHSYGCNTLDATEKHC